MLIFHLRLRHLCALHLRVLCLCVLYLRILYLCVLSARAPSVREPVFLVRYFAVLAVLTFFSVSISHAATETASLSLQQAVVVTASRSAQPVAESPVVIEIIDREKFDSSSGYFVTDILKKNASVDVIQYPGGLSGIGLRGFRPQFSGVHQRVLMLVDGRPAGATNMGAVASAGLDRVEVLKGSASAIYGASAMGGVVNFITRKSEDDIGGNLAAGYGSFDNTRVSGNVGGAISDNVSFDLGLTHQAQREDFRIGRGGKTYGDFTQGQGATRPNTEFEHSSFFARGAVRLPSQWEAQLRLSGFDAPDSETPGAESDGINNQGEKSERNLGGDASLSGDVGNHRVLALAYSTREISDSFNKPVAATAYRSSSRTTRFSGVQLQDSWAIHDSYNLILGFDRGQVENESASFNADNSRRGAFTPNFRQTSNGVFADLTSYWLDERLIVSTGVRHDEIESRVLATPLRQDLTPGSTRFDTVNPRLGIVVRPLADSPLRLHASAGTGFIAPEASQVAGLSAIEVGNQVRITRGNPQLEPESSTSYDIGIGYDSDLFGLDLTWFYLAVDDRISSVITTNTADLRETTYENADGSLAKGVELSAQFDAGALFGAAQGHWTGDMSSTYYSSRDEEVSTGTRTLNNVARLKLNAGLQYADAQYSVRFSGRHVSGMEDNDFTPQGIFTAGARDQYEYPSFSVFDLSARWYFLPQQQLTLKVDNIGNKYYVEKGDYPMPGRGFQLEYHYSL